MLPSDQGASERASLDRVVLVLEVPAELGHPLECEIGIAVGVELSNRFFGLPHGGHIAVGITGTQQADELLPSTVVQPLLRLGQKAPAAVEGVRLVATMSEVSFCTGVGTRPVWSWPA